MPELERGAPTSELAAVDAWIARHPYLRAAAGFDMAVKEVLAGFQIPITGIPRLDHYSNDYRAGVPLLHSDRIHMDHHALERVLSSVIENLASSDLPGTLAEECRALRDELSSDSVPSGRIVYWLLGQISLSTEKPGALRYVGWTILARSLQAVVQQFGEWRDEEHWLRNYCPTCGAVPAMGQLCGTDPGRLRFLFCGCCRTRWRYRRTACPFCEMSADHRLLSLSVEGENSLRIDYCDACRGYIKTYVGNGNEVIFLSDWTSIHLDIIARDHNLRRNAGSLYQV